MDKLLKIRNGEKVDRREIPLLPFEDFARSVAGCVRDGGFVVQHFAYGSKEPFRIMTILRKENELFAATTETGSIFRSLTGSASEKFHMFEREIAEQYGLKPDGHPWLKMVRYHANTTGLKDVFDNDYKNEIPGNYPYYRVEGDGIHEVAVGPVHAGIIEPGHFRFQCAGEEVLHLEIQLGYQHRGVEKMLQSLALNRLPIICEGIAGDTSVGHNLCHCQAIEALAGLKVDGGARIARTIALELERIANHIGDLGALSGDVAFNPPAAYFGRIRGEFLNLLQVLCGNRFGKGLVRSGGISYPMTEEQRCLIGEKIDEVAPEIANVCDLLFSAHTVQARFEQTGSVSYEDAEALGLVGYAGRACGLSYDVRANFPTECFSSLPGNSNSCTNGDVHSRAWVRKEEIEHSLELISKLLALYDEQHPEPLATSASDVQLSPNSMVVSLNEGWRGELSHCIMTDQEGKIERYKVKDPSFHNWTGLAMSLRNQGISDFPLCNKSFNLSYCGFDL